MSDYIPDYNDLFHQHDAEQERILRKHPKCDCCGDRIVDDKFYNIEGTYICKVCIEDYKVDTEDYMEE